MMKTTSSAINNTIFAISTAANAMPPKPTTPAISGMIRSATTRPNLLRLSLLCSFLSRSNVRIAQLPAENAAERCCRAAEQERHEGPEGEVSSCLGDLVRSVAGLGLYLADAALRLVRRQPRTGSNHSRA